MSELWHQPLPRVNLEGLEWALMRQLIVEQWRRTDRALVTAYQERHRAAEVRGDGDDELQVGSRFGVLQLPRPVCYNANAGGQVLAGNTALPPPNGQLTTRGLPEWLCRLPQEVPFATAQRLLGWLAGEPAVVSTTQLRRWVQHHGGLIRPAEQAEAQGLLEREQLSDGQARLAPLYAPRRPGAWEQRLNEAVEQALMQPEPVAPVGVSASDWERVLQARREEREIERRRRLGPQLQLGERVASADEVGVRRPEKRRWLEIRTACVRPTTGYRSLSGTAQAVLQQLYGLLLLCGG